MLLDGARQGVQVARPGVAGQRGPGGKRLACGRDGAVHVRLAGLRDARQPGRGGGVDDVEPRVALSFGPAPADEQSECAVLPGDPLEGRLVALGRRPVGHRIEDF